MAVDHAQMLRGIKRAWRGAALNVGVSNPLPWLLGVSPWCDYAFAAAIVVGLAAGLATNTSVGFLAGCAAFLGLHLVVAVLVRFGLAPTWWGILRARLAAYKPHVIDAENWNHNLAPALDEGLCGSRSAEQYLYTIDSWLEWERWAVAMQPPTPPNAPKRPRGTVVPFPGRKEKRP